LSQKEGSRTEKNAEAACHGDREENGLSPAGPGGNGTRTGGKGHFNNPVWQGGLKRWKEVQI